MAIVYPSECNTPGERLAWLERAKYLTKIIHNAFNIWHRNGLTLTQYNKFPQKVKNNFSYAPKISDSEWNRFNEDFLEPLNSKICNQLGIQRAAGSVSTKWTVKIENI